MHFWRIQHICPEHQKWPFLANSYIFIIFLTPGNFFEGYIVTFRGTLERHFRETKFFGFRIASDVINWLKALHLWPNSIGYIGLCSFSMVLWQLNMPAWDFQSSLNLHYAQDLKNRMMSLWYDHIWRHSLI